LLATILKEKLLKRKLLAIEVLALLLIAAGSLLLAGTYPKIEQTATYQFVHEVTLENRGLEPYVLEDLWIWAPLNTTTQTSYVIDFSPEGSWLSDVQGNPYLAVPEITLQAGSATIARITVKIITETSWSMGGASSEAGCFSSIPNELVNQYCNQEGPFQTNDPQLISLAETIHHGANCTMGNVLNVLETTIKWIDDNIRYETHVPPLYPNQTLQERSGDCDEKANLLITLCRIMKIPAYLQTGFVVQSNETSTYLDGHYRSNGLVGHAWAMVYVPPWGWLPVDLTYYEDPLDPLSHITASAWARGLVIQGANIVKTDYIAEWRSWAEELYRHDIYELDKYELTTMSNETKIVYPIYFFIGIALLSIGASTIVALRIQGRRKARKGPTSLEKTSDSCTDEQEACSSVNGSTSS